MNSRLIGSRINECRVSSKLTLQDVANEVGVAKSTILRYEKGTIESIKLPVIEAIARALKVNPSYLLGKVDNKEVPLQLSKGTNTEFDEAVEIFKQLTPDQYQLVLEHAKAYAELNSKRTK